MTVFLFSAFLHLCVVFVFSTFCCSAYLFASVLVFSFVFLFVAFFVLFNFSAFFACLSQL